MRKSNIKFKGREHSKQGIFSMLLGLLSIITFIVISFVSGYAKGMGGIELGVVGLVSAACSVLGFLLSIRSFKEKDIYLTAPIMGIGLNGIMLVVYFCLYIVGILS